MSITFGDRKVFAIEYIGENDGLIEANVFVSGENITPLDNAHYDQHFVHGSLTDSADLFIKNLNWFKYDQELKGDGVEERFINLWDSEYWSQLEIFDWAPCTNQYRCAVVPYFEELYLCCAENQFPDKVYMSKFYPFYLANDLLSAREYIVTKTKNPLLKLSFT